MSARPGFDLTPVTPGDGPERLGRYRIVGVLGGGAMGIVYKAVDPQLDRLVALKVIRAPLLAPGAEDYSATRRFATEARAAGRLNHPNIVSVYEFGDCDSGHFIAMEHVAGGSLQQLLAGGRRLPLEDVLAVMGQLLDGLACAHAEGVWHRDIKPANLLVSRDGRLKITDFGIAQIDMADATRQSIVLGSPGYMAPERYTGEPCDERVDVFACGVLLHELLTGRAPFVGSSGAMMYQVLHQHAPAPSAVPMSDPPPVAFDAVVARAMAKRAEDRFPGIAAMREALREAAGRPLPGFVGPETLARLPRPDGPPAAPVPRPLAAAAEAAPSEPTRLLPRLVDRVPTDELPIRHAMPLAVAEARLDAPAQRPQTLPTDPAATAAAFDPSCLKAIEAALLPRLGPITPVVVRRAAQASRDLPALLTRLAATALPAAEREAFVAEAMRALPMAAALPASAAGPLAPPTLGTTPIRPGVTDAAARVLLRHVGPMAPLVVRQAAAGAVSAEQLFAAIVERAGAHVDRRVLMAELWRAMPAL